MTAVAGAQPVQVGVALAPGVLPFDLLRAALAEIVDAVKRLVADGVAPSDLAFGADPGQPVGLVSLP